MAARVPDQVVNLLNNAAVTTAFQIALTWQPGSFNGGTPVLDYRVNYRAYPDGVSQIYSDTVTNDYVTVLGLTSGTTYEFTIEARNLVGYSPASDPI